MQRFSPSLTMRRGLFAAILAPALLTLVGCGDDAETPEPDAVTDVEQDTTADAHPDTTADVDQDTAADTGPTPDGTGDVGPDAAPDASPDADPEPPEWPWPEDPITVPPSDAWKSRFSFPSDPFLVQSWSMNPLPGWLKFTVLTGSPDIAYIQDGNDLPFHFDFATRHLPPFIGMDPDTFNTHTLYDESRLAILGGILFAPPNLAEGGVDLSPREIGVQLVSHTPLPTHVAIRVLETIRASQDLSDEGTPPRYFYMPTFEQQAAAQAAAAAFEAAGFPLSSPGRWVRGDICYSPGWNIGRLVEIAPDAIDAAYASGALGPTDILVTSGIPAEIPPVGGILSFAPSTPLSHVALLANNFQIPFAYAARESTRARITAALGERVAVRARTHGSGATGFDGCEIDVTRVEGFEGALSERELDALLEMKRPRPIVLPPLTLSGQIAGPTRDLTPADIVHYGGKAANFGTIQRAIPDNTRDPVLGLTVDLFQRFLDIVPLGFTDPLRVIIANRLAPYQSWPVEDMAGLTTALNSIRSLIRSDSVAFAAADASAILDALLDAGFDTDTRIRFRSSTNVEDADFFTGAGLYSSHSGCLGDDLDEDDVGPSRCNPERPTEQGVFRAIKRVYASMWNDNAYFERLRHQVDEERVFMGILCHYSYPDEIELANGVATVSVLPGTFNRRVLITTQKGAESVTNPTGNAEPEVVTVHVSNFGSWKELEQRSSLVLLGGYVMDWEDDYDALVDLLNAVTDLWGQDLPSGTMFTLDFEFKKVEPGRLEVKQVRPLPRPSTTPTISPWLLPSPEPVERCIFQGENSTALGLHRAKARVALRNRGLQLTARNLDATFWTHWDLHTAHDGERYHFDAAPEELGGFFHEPPDLEPFSYDGAIDGFEWMLPGRDAIEWSLSTNLRWLVSEAEVPLLTVDDAQLLVRLGFSRELYDPDHWAGGMVDFATAVLGPCPEDVVITPSHSLQEREVTGPDGLRFELAFYWPPPPTGIVAGYTAPAVKWERTVIHGLTEAPFTLEGYWSQTYRPGHHNFTEAFVLEPRLEEGLDPAVLAELAALDVAMIRLDDAWQGQIIEVMGFDGRWRTIAGGGVDR